MTIDAVEKYQRCIDVLLARIFQSDRGIRYCAVIDEKGRENPGGMRPGIKSLESESESPRLQVQSVIALAMEKPGTSFMERRII